MDYCATNRFGPANCSGQFDFTLVFEQAFFVIVPAAVFLIAAPWRLYWIRKATIKTLPNSRHRFKIVIATIFALLQLTLLVLSCTYDTLRTITSTAGAVLSFIVSLSLVLLSHLEHTRAARPSTLICVYLIFTIVFDAVQIRTLFLSKENVAIPVLLCCNVGTKVTLLILEAASKKAYLRRPYASHSPEATAGILDRTFLWWLNRIFVIGFRKLMTYEDLFPITPEMGAKILGKRMQTSWRSYRSTCRTEIPSKWTLPLATLSCFKWEVLSALPSRLFLIGFNYAQPFLFARAINFLNQPVTQESKNIGYGLIGATALVYIGIALCTVHYQQRMYKTLTMFRGAMVTLVFNHSTELSEAMNAEKAAISHMSTDIDTLARSLVEINEFWARAIEVFLGVGLLARDIGAVCVVPIVLVVISTYVQSFVSKTIGSKRMAWNDSIQRRVSTTASMLHSMKSIKIMGLSSVVGALIQQACLQELHVSRGFMWLILSLNFIAVIPSTWAPTLTFVVYAIQARLRHTKSLETAQAFTSLALLTLITSPASRLLTVMPQVASAMGCFGRLQEFLILPVISKQPADLLHQRDLSLSRNPSENAIRTELVCLPPKAFISDHHDTAIDVKNLTLSPEFNASPAVKNVSFRIEKVSFAILLGPTGSGKSTLLKGLLGELQVDHGSISMSSRMVGYCAQIPWLVNLSVRHNVLGPLVQDQAVDETWYQAVIHACCLEPDLLILAEGDLSIVGSNGTALSGGQRQRIALARAVYSRHHILLLDDVVSALDQGTTKIVLERLFGPQGLLRQTRTTVILATHSDAVLAFADTVLVMNGSGDLLRSLPSSASMRDIQRSTLSFSSPEAEQTSKHNPKERFKRNVAPKGPSEDDHKALSAKTGDIKVYKYYFSSIGRFYLLAFLFTTILATFCTSFSQVWLQWWTSSGGQRLDLYLPIFGLLALLSNVFTNANMWMMFLNIMPRSVVNLHGILLDTVISAPLSLFSRTDTGHILNRFSQDISLISMVLPTSMLASGIALFDSIAQVALICASSSYMAVTIPFVLVAVFFIQNIYLRTSRQLRFLDLEAKAPIYSHFLEVGEGIATVRAFGWQESAKDRNAELVDISQSPYYLMYCIQRWLQLVLDLLVAAVAVLVVALAVSLRSSSSAGLLGVALNNVLSFNQSLSRLIREWTNLETSLSAISRIETFSATVASECDGANPSGIPESWPSSASITFQNVSATYGYDISPPVLHDINLHISPGQKVGICGRTGSGKSSLFLALLRIVRLTSGSIMIDGVDITTIPYDILRSRLTAVPQDPFLIPGTLRQNLEMANPSLSNESIVFALQKVRLWSALESRGGLDMEMQKDSLSQGQLQLLSLARAMLKNTKILLLDEATSNLDRETDQIIQDVIRKEFESCTVIAIAHRLETIKSFDKIAVLDNGRLVSFDTPEVILKRYDISKLVEQQDGVAHA